MSSIDTTGLKTIELKTDMELVYLGFPSVFQLIPISTTNSALGFRLRLPQRTRTHGKHDIR